MMTQVDLSQLIEAYGIDAGVLSLLLFPKNKFPMSALNRMLNEKMLLNSEQLAALSEFLNIPVDALFTREGGWSSKEITKNSISFTKDGFVVTLNLATFVTNISKDNEVLANHTLVKKGITLRDYLQLIDIHINQIKQQHYGI